MSSKITNLHPRPAASATRIAAVNDPDTQAKVQALAAGWRNYVATQLNMSRDTFQLVQGSLGLQTSDSYGLFVMADVVPPPSVVGNYDAGGSIRRTQSYGNLLNALLSESNPNGMRQALGDYYTEYLTWRKTNSPAAGESPQAFFVRVGNALPDIDPGRLSRAAAAMASANNSELGKAQTALWYNAAQYQQTFSPPSGPVTLYTYTGTADNALQAVQGGPTAKLHFDSSTMDSNANSTFASGSASGFYDIFSGNASGSFEQLNSKAAASGFTIDGTIDAYATLATQPTGWYDGAEVARGYNAPSDATVWDPGSSAGSWDSFFGQPNGSLSRRVSQLLLVSGYDITVTSMATYNESEFQQIKTNANFGVWPFFSGSASYEHTMSSQLTSSGNLATTFHLDKGKIQIWGVSVVNAPN
jgi:hypothetical protein